MNTINNVPRELLNIAALHLEYSGHTETGKKLRTLLDAAPSPAGVDGCKCSMSISMLGDGCRHCQPQEYIDRLGEMLDEELAELSDAQAIIDGLRGEVEALKHSKGLAISGLLAEHKEFCARFESGARAIMQQRDQQAQRIGELEGLLRDFAYHTQRREMPTESSLAAWADRIDAALSAGKEGE